MDEKVRSEFICSFYDLYQQFSNALINGCDKINGEKRLKIISAYSGILFGYCKEIEILLSTNWYTSIIPLTRDLVECYATVKKLEICFPIQTDFDEYFRYLVLKDIIQDKTIYQQLESDKTIIDKTRRDNELNEFLDRFEKLINEYFPIESMSIDKNKLKASLFSTIKNINQQNFNDKNKYPNKDKFIGEMLYQNNAWKNDSGGTPYEKSYAIYSTLCHATHNNLSSVEERTINNGYFTLNNQPSHIEAILSLAYYCTTDALEEFKNILV